MSAASDGGGSSDLIGVPIQVVQQQGVDLGDGKFDPLWHNEEELDPFSKATKSSMSIAYHHFWQVEDLSQRQRLI
uniref:Uncharacterized protein n=2 Tax=Setaria TaxID=4554 RepID=K3XUM9_SETIT|nr:hypothetical protein SEVIR_5G259733v2 [Setaria viridis]